MPQLLGILAINSRLYSRLVLCPTRYLLFLNPGEAIILFSFLPNMKLKEKFPKGKNVIFSMDMKERKTENQKTL